MFPGHIFGFKGLGPGPPPSGADVMVGHTLFVSTRGNDATGAYENLTYHYLTLDAAIADLQTSQDVIVIYPGFWNINNTVPGGIFTLNLFLHPEAQVSVNNTLAGVFQFNAGGDGDITFTANNSLSNAGSTNISARQIRFEDINTFSHEWKINCKQFICQTLNIANGSIFEINSVADIQYEVLNINSSGASYIRLTATRIIGKIIIDDTLNHPWKCFLNGQIIARLGNSGWLDITGGDISEKFFVNGKVEVDISNRAAIILYNGAGLELRNTQITLNSNNIIPNIPIIDIAGSLCKLRLYDVIFKTTGGNFRNDGLITNASLTNVIILENFKANGDYSDTKPLITSALPNSPVYIYSAITKNLVANWLDANTIDQSGSVNHYENPDI